jgi:hypothetical protein
MVVGTVSAGASGTPKLPRFARFRSTREWSRRPSATSHSQDVGRTGSLLQELCATGTQRGSRRDGRAYAPERRLASVGCGRRALWRRRPDGMLFAPTSAEDFMERRTLEQLEAALEAVSRDLAPRVEELAQKSTEGTLTPEEHREYEEVVRLNDRLSLLKLEAEEFWAMRAAS